MSDNGLLLGCVLPCAGVGDAWSQVAWSSSLPVPEIVSFCPVVHESPRRALHCEAVEQQLWFELGCLLDSYRIGEFQRGEGWKGPVEVMESNCPVKQDHLECRHASR